jgi:hydrogenase-4 component F
MLSALLTFLAALSLFFVRPPVGRYLLVDDLNNVFIVLTTFVAFTTSVFSASYIGHELETGRLTPVNLRFYHAMYQLLMFAMNLALIANNIGLMWVAIELATLTTVLMVGIYRTHEALEAAWKYFILGSVGIALRAVRHHPGLHGGAPGDREGLDAMIWTVLIERASRFDPELLNVAFVFLLLGYGTKVGLAPLHAWLPDAHAEGPTPISAVLSGLLLNVALYALLRFKLLLAANPGALTPGPLMVMMGLISLVFAGLHALPPARHQTHVRLFVDRAHGHHHLRVRYRRAAGQFRRPLAHDDAFAHQVGDLLRSRPHRAGQGHAEDRRHGRLTVTHPRSAGGWCSASWRSPACRRSACS